MREGTQTQRDRIVGAHDRALGGGDLYVFTLDDEKHNPFETLERLMTKLGYTPPERDDKLDDVLRKRMLANEAEVRAKRQARER